MVKSNKSNLLFIQLFWIQFLVTFILTNTAYSQKEIYAFARQDGKWGLIDQNGDEIIEFSYDIVFSPGAEWLPYNNPSKALIFPPSDGMVKARKGNKYGFYDLRTGYNIPHQFQEATDFKDNISIVYTGYKYGVINRKVNYYLNQSLINW